MASTYVSEWKHAVEIPDGFVRAPEGSIARGDRIGSKKNGVVSWTPATNHLGQKIARYACVIRPATARGSSAHA